ncbi:MAG: EVE domain-containing protein [Alphaproteobacteria bacterium]
MKSEPETWSWEQQLAQRTTSWDGVRNYQASHFLRQMVLGDLAFFYHSGKQRAIVGLVKITKTYYPDPSDISSRFGMVDVEAVSALKHPVSLHRIKAEPCLQHIGLVRQSRLSVMPIDRASFQLILEWGGGLENPSVA